MLRGIRVSGFKSLEGFELTFQKGLNVIVGPNGSGKTNIINFLEFLSNLCRSNLLSAVSRSGGAGRIFRRHPSGSLNRKITLDVWGEGNSEEYRGKPAEWAMYEYSAEISLSENYSTLAYTKQRLKIHAFDNSPQPSLYGVSGSWPFDVELSLDDKELVSFRFHSVDSGYLFDRYGPNVKAEKPEETVARIKQAVSEMAKDLGRSVALYSILERYVRNLNVVSNDIVGARSFNIVPSVVRMPEDIASEPEIAEDGRGLAATLFALKNSETSVDFGFIPFYVPMYLYREPAKVLEKIVAFSRLVNESIVQIVVEPDTIENKLRIFLYVDYQDAVLKLPFSLASDGTAKWFALITVILTTSSVFAIEEPENYLHPLMQREIVNITRNTFSETGNERFAVMTTHSETILNCIDPDEMIIVGMVDGRTHAVRPGNSDDIRAEIKKTGFGAGYYYLAGAME